MYIVISQYYESCFVFSPLQPFNYKQSHFALASLVAILRNGRSSCQKVFPVSPPRKLAERKFLCSNVQSLKVLSTRIAGMLMFSEIGKLRARKNFLYPSWEVCSKIMFTMCKFLKKGLRPG